MFSASQKSVAVAHEAKKPSGSKLGEPHQLRSV
jgi:hypothetical protein